MADIVYDRKMSDIEGLMWRLERAPHLSSTFANVSILDRPPDFDRFRRRMERGALVVPRLRQVARPTAGDLGAPVWVDDPEFSIDTHVRRIALPEPGTDRQLLDLATLIVGDPLDRTRPLWQFVVVEGLEGHRAALIEKLHHTISDGESGVRLAFEFLDLERDAPEPAMPTARDRSEVDDCFEEDPTAVMVRDVLLGALRVPLGVARQVRELLAEPSQIPDASDAATETLEGIVHELGAVDQARSPLWTQRSTRRRLDVATAPLAETKAVAERLGGTLNTAFVTIAAEAAGRYHAEFCSPVDALRTSMAISTRTDGSGANVFSLARLLVPTADMPLDERFRSIGEATRSVRDGSASAPLEKLAAFASVLPTPIVTCLVRRHAETVDFATSNVRGSPAPVYVAGARLLHNCPIGPLGGVAFNLTLLSYEDHLDVGVNTDTAAVEQPEVLRRELNAAIARFVAL